MARWAFIKAGEQTSGRAPKCRGCGKAIDRRQEGRVKLVMGFKAGSQEMSEKQYFHCRAECVLEAEDPHKGGNELGTPVQQLAEKDWSKDFDKGGCGELEELLVQVTG